VFKNKSDTFKLIISLAKLSLNKTKHKQIHYLLHVFYFNVNVRSIQKNHPAGNEAS